MYCTKKFSHLRVLHVVVDQQPGSIAEGVKRIGEVHVDSVHSQRVEVRIHS